MADIIFKAAWLSTASPAVALTSTELTGAAAPTINVSATAIATGAITSVVSGGAMTYDSYTESWSYRLASADLATYVYLAEAKTTYASAAQACQHCIGLVVPDALVSSRSTLDAAGVRTAVGMAAADLDTQLSGIAAAVWAYTTRTLTSLAALVSSIAAAVWAYATRTLTSSAAATTAAVSGSVLTLTRYARYSATLSGLTIPADWEWLDFTAKVDVKDADSAAILRLRVSNPGVGTDGLLYLEGAAGTLADGSLTVDQAGGTVTLAVNEDATSLLDTHIRIPYDVKVMSTSAGPYELTSNVLSVKDMVTQATS